MHTKVDIKITDAFAATVKEKVSAYSGETKKYNKTETMACLATATDRQQTHSHAY